MLLTPTHLLSSENCPPHLTPLTSPLHHQHLHSSTKLSHLVGDVDDSGQGLEAGGMQIFLERKTGQAHLGFPFFSAICR